MNRAVITGIGLISPCGTNLEDFKKNLYEGISFVDFDDEMNRLMVKSKVNCKIKDFNLRKHIEEIEKYLSDHQKKYINDILPKQALFIQYGVISALKAIYDSNFLLKDKLIPEESSVIFTSAIGGSPTIQKIYEYLTDMGQHDISYKDTGGIFYNAGMINYISLFISNLLELKGLCTSMSTGCTGGIDSIGLALDVIRSGKSKIVIAGSSEAPLCGITYATLDAINALSVAEGDYNTRSRPFDLTRKGFVISEGSGVLIIEEYEHAKARGAQIYCEVLGYSSSNNALHMTDLVEEGESMSRTIDSAIKDSKTISAEDIDYINAHGSSTPQNDVFETKAFKKSLGDNAYSVKISSTKSLIGHSLASASMFGSIATICSITDGIIHPTINLKFKDPECDLDYVPLYKQKVNVNCALITASGFGGIHSALILKKEQE